MNREEFAKEVNLNKELIRSWEKEFDIEIPRDENKYRTYGQRELEIYQMIIKLRENNKPSEIKKMLKNTDNLQSNLQSDLQTKKQSVNAENKTDNANISSEVLTSFKSEITTQITKINTNLESKFTEYAELSYAYADVSAKLGFLTASLLAEQEKNRLLIQSYESEKRLLSDYSSKSVTGLENKIQTLEENLQSSNNSNNQLKDIVSSKDKDIENLKQQLEAEKSKGIKDKIKDIFR